jgi:nitrous-oxide reductase
MKRLYLIVAILLMLPAVAYGCRRADVDTSGQPREVEQSEPAAEVEQGDATGSVAISSSASEIAAARGLSPDDISAALKTYVPSGSHDEYVMFSSGGHSGQMLVIGIPSMRLLKVVGVFTPEPWQGWGVGAVGTEDVLRAGDPRPNKQVDWADTHHPALSETAGDYDGQFVFINDKAHARIAVIDLRDFETKQIVKNPVADVDHGGAFVTPNTEWVIEGGQYATPLGGEYAPLEDYEASYRGHVTFWKFDREAGRIDMAKSFAMELPPYWQDLCDAGKLVSEGWVFCNTFNSEMATGNDGSEEGVFFESGVSQNDMDYMNVINLEKAAEVALGEGTTEVNGMTVIPMDLAVAEELLYFLPEPKSPHGVDVTPGGDYLVVSGKLDPHVTVYGWQLIQDAIAAGEWDTDPYGIPILPFDKIVEAQVEVGLGPLHTQYDDKGYAYTSLFLDTAVARWSLGGDYRQDGAEPWQLITKTPVQYNVGHLAAAEGDTVSPDGKFLVSLNKWAIDRFQNVGPLLPQNFQLIDISGSGEEMPVLYDMPIGVGEPHYAQIIKADKLAGWQTYPEVGWDPGTMAKSEFATMPGEERIVRDGNNVEIFMTAVRSHFVPERVELQEGDNVTWHITNIETAHDATHGFALPIFNANLSLEPGETETMRFVADEPGVFAYYCTEFCSALHLEMIGYMLIEPEGGVALAEQ